ncbi:pyridoxamine 5'-phosphate oxidase family protein [Candidatus Saccharibacteria bacterium]|nr:MAG: pyridoxamine 5'-phosphate oxidase family protein [Candidatus Saccharibacteria bacterium]
MQLATVGKDGKPWVCNVWFAADKDQNIYWFSATTRRHSIEVMQNPHVAASICLPQTPADKPRGLQLEGTAEQLTNPKDIAVAMKHYVGRVFSLKQVKDFMAHLDRPHRFYRIKVESFVLLTPSTTPTTHDRS